MNRDYMDVNMIKYCNEQEALIRKTAQSLIDQYWGAWKTQNRFNLAKGEQSALGRFAPMIRQTSTGHVDIDWRDFGPTSFRKKNKSLSKRVKPYRDGYKQTQFAREAQPWELDLIAIHLEDINQVRAELKAIHQCRIVYQRYLRKYDLNKLTHTQTQPEETAND